MSLRELIILLLGLAIIGIILRGLFVALQTRRGQLRIAIDKNIPTDVDLDSLELAELPGGGARVVRRDGALQAGMLSKLERATMRAEALDLEAEDEAVPLLMDSVAVGYSDALEGFSSEERSSEDTDAQLTELTESSQQNAFEARRVAGETEASQHGYEPSDRADNEIGQIDASGEPPDEVLLDYEEGGGDPSESVFITADPDAPTNEEGSSEQSDEFDEPDEAQGLEESPDEPNHESEADDELNEFSMTAGERIGGNPSTPAQTALFDGGDHHSAKRNAGAETLVSRAAALLGSRRKRQIVTAVASSPTVRERPDSFVFEEDDEAVRGQEAVSPEVAVSGNLADELNGIDEDASEEQAVAAGQQLDRLGSAPVETQKEVPNSRPSKVRQQSSVARPAEVLVCNVMAREGFELHGDDLLEALITNGLKFGEMNIFHKRSLGKTTGPVIFSVANILNPGTFDLNSMTDFRTSGVSLFLALPSPTNNLEAFDHMLDVAIQLKESLDGELKDDHRNVMTSQTIEHYRQRIKDFELRQLRAAGNSA
ncbi:MAG: cell division protein ZipA [Pseudomonadota bacterium]|nr:cell division protein ZipA [Pseudomonadota bacterium]